MSTVSFIPSDHYRYPSQNGIITNSRLLIDLFIKNSSNPKNSFPQLSPLPQIYPYPQLIAVPLKASCSKTNCDL